MILEVIATVTSGAAIVSALWTATKMHRLQLKQKQSPLPPSSLVSDILASKVKPKPEHQGTLPWSIYALGKGFTCPKCWNVSKNQKQYPICKCKKYSLEHYHFRCGDCKYTNILRTADDI